MTGEYLLSIIPCYNEAGNIATLISRFRLELTGRDDIELVLVNNG